MIYLLKYVIVQSESKVVHTLNYRRVREKSILVNVDLQPVLIFTMQGIHIFPPESKRPAKVKSKGKKSTGKHGFDLKLVGGFYRFSQT